MRNQVKFQGVKLILFLFIGVFALSACTIDINWPEGMNVGTDSQEESGVEIEGETSSETESTNPEESGLCGNNECDEDRDSCCMDCGCDEGLFCSEDNICKEVFQFKPLPLEATMLFQNEEKVSPIMSTIKPMMITFGIAPKTATIISEKEMGGVSRPSIYGNKVVFHEFESSSPIVKMYDTITKQISEIPYEGRAETPNVGAGVIVWTDYSRGFADNSDIYYYNFSENQQGYVSPRNDYQSGAKTFGQAVIWSEQVDNTGGRALYLLWLPSMEETRIFYKKNRIINDFEIWGASVVYSVTDCSDMSNCFSELRHYDIAKKEDKVLLTTAKEDIYSVSIWDNKISYIAGGDNQSLYSYDLDSKLTDKLTSVVSEKYDTATYMDMVVWADKRDGDYEIYLYDLAKSEEKRLTDNNKDDRYPDIYDKNVVFKNGNMNIELIEIN